MRGRKVGEVRDADARGIDRVIEVGDRLAAGYAPAVASFLFLRHGRTSANHLGIIQGQKDVPLDEVGRGQAQAAAETLRRAAVRPRRIVSSDLSRAAETARILARGLGMRVAEYDAGLRERNFGTAQGRSASRLIWHSDPPGAESIEDFVRRCGEAMGRHLREPETLVVAHGGVLRATAALLRRPLPGGGSANAVPLAFRRTEAGWCIELIAREVSLQEVQGA